MTSDADMERYRSIARAKYNGAATPFRVGQALAEHIQPGEELTVPYRAGTRGHIEFINGIKFGISVRNKRSLP